MRWLRKLSDGYIYPYTDALAARGDMEEVSNAVPDAPSASTDASPDILSGEVSLEDLRQQAKKLKIPRYWIKNAETLQEEIKSATARPSRRT